MNKLPKNQKGFGVIEVLLVVVVVALAGGVGWLVYKHNHRSLNSTSTNTPATRTTEASSKAAQTNQSTDPTTGWATYASSSGGFSFKYPKDWAITANETGCSTGLLMLGANSSSVGKCGTNNFGQMTVTWQQVRTSCGLTSAYWTVNSTKTVTVSGVSGTETVGTAKTGASAPVGTSTVQYCFVKNQTMYIADYTQLSTYPDVLSDFNLMVTKTLILN